MALRFGSSLLLGALALGCSDPAGPNLSDQPQLVLQISDLDWRSLPDASVTISAARVEGRKLFLTVRYGGGCATHRFALVAGTAFGQSLPPFTLFRLAHDDGGDLCEALQERILEVDLSPIVPLVQQGGGTALRFELLEPVEQRAAVGELLLTF